MKSDLENLKLEIVNLESLSRESKEIIDCWIKIIQTVLEEVAYPDVAALFISKGLNQANNPIFDRAAIEWVALLVIKWRSKTRDINQQAESIAFAIYNQRRV
jgi:hypothetical protein